MIIIVFSVMYVAMFGKRSFRIFYILIQPVVQNVIKLGKLAKI